MPPLKRQNPPFTEQQITDAENEERGLLTTWELFKGYYLVEENIVDKEYIRKKILNNGLISFAPDEQQFLGKVKECLKESTVLILDLDDILIKKGESLIVESDERYQKIKILNLQIDGNDVEEASLGEVGVSVDKPVKRNAKVFLSFK